jgi:hypothetical protein
MTTATMPLAVRMRPVACANDSLTAAGILAEFVGDEPWKLDELVPGGSTFKPVEIAEDGSAAVFEVFASSEWGVEHSEATPLARVIVRR